MRANIDDALDLYEAGDFAAAATLLGRILRTERRLADEDRADLHYYLASCLDRAGDLQRADEHFAAAARLAPEDYPLAPRETHAAFEKLVASALDTIPERFARYLRQVQVVAQDYPGVESEDPFVLGLYVGVPRTERDQYTLDHLDTVYVYKRAHELDFPDEEERREEVRKTIVHEIGHHFGMEEDEMGEYT